MPPLSVRYPILSPDVELQDWPAELDKREEAWGHEDDPPLRLDRLETCGTFAPPRPKRTGLIRGLLAIPFVILLWAAIWVLL